MNAPVLPAKPKAPTPSISSIPLELRNTARWLVWWYKFDGYKKDTGEPKWRKVPATAENRWASPVDPANWTSFDDAYDLFLTGDYDGIGFAFSDDDDLVGIDIDDCITNGKLSAAAQEVLDRIEGYAEVSPSGTGIKIFTRAAGSFGSKSGNFEAYSVGRYFTVTGKVLEARTGIPTGAQDINWFLGRFMQTTVAEASADALANYKGPLPDWTIDRTRDELLRFISPETDYKGWMDVGMALYHQFEGSDEALALWDEWSGGFEDGCASYESGACELKWQTFSVQRASGRGAITLGTLIHLTKEAKKSQVKQRFEEWCAKIESCPDSFELKDRICAEIGKDPLLDLASREAIVQVIKTRFKALKYTLPVGTVRSLVAKKADFRLHRDLPDWLDGWVFNQGEDRFFHLPSKRTASITGFNAEFNRFVGESEDSPNAAKVATDFYHLPVVSDVIYMPKAAELFMNEADGKWYGNLYRQGSAPEVPSALTPQATKAIDIVDKHFLHLTGGDEVIAGHLKHWIAFCVQNPGDKIQWSPLIKGTQGDGKSTIGMLCRAVMGPENVKEISPRVLATDFTSWAQGACIGVLDEIRVSGQSKFDICDHLKPYITNDYVEVHRKGKDQLTVPNTVNYIAFTNHADALPMDKDERRWFIVFTPFTTREQLLAAIPGDYFDKLYEAIRNYPGALRKWFLEMDLPETFSAKSVAPMTEAKQLMIALSKSDEEMALAEVLSQRAYGISGTVFSSECISTALEMTHQLTLKTTSLSRLLVKAGLMRADRLVKWDGKPRRLWYRSEVAHLAADNEYLRTELDRTKGGDSLLE